MTPPFFANKYSRNSHQDRLTSPVIRKLTKDNQEIVRRRLSQNCPLKDRILTEAHRRIAQPKESRIKNHDGSSSYLILGDMVYAGAFDGTSSAVRILCGLSSFLFLSVLFPHCS